MPKRKIEDSLEQAKKAKVTRHTCSTCGANFVQKGHLVRHETTHVSNQFECDKCGAKFGRKEHVKRHLEKHLVDKTLSSYSETEPAENDENCIRQLDPLEPPFSVDELIKVNWNRIRSCDRMGKLQNMYNFRLPNDLTIPQMLRFIFQQQNKSFKFTISPGYILRNRLTDELKYYYSCCNNNPVFENPISVTDNKSLGEAMEKLRHLDENLYDYAFSKKPTSQWIVEEITNITFFVNKLLNHPMGAAISLPDYVRKNKGLYCLVHGACGAFNDMLCIFRCLALHFGAKSPLALERKAKTLLEVYKQARNLRNFKGIALSSMDKIEKCFKVGVMVYELDSKGSATLIRRPANRWPVMRLNKYDAHFSFIHNFKLYAKSFNCQRCGSFWKSAWHCDRHQKACDGSVKVDFIGGPLKLKPTIWQLLEEEGIKFDEHDTIFPYRATFDLEFYMTAKNKQAMNTSYIAEHTPMSASVASNVPDFQEPRCFVSDGDSSKMTSDMMNYLNTISDKSFELLSIRYQHVFEQLKTSKMQYHVKLMKQFAAYLSELPVIGFNSAKYDLRALKRFLVPYFIQNDNAKYIIKKDDSYIMIKTERLRFLDICNFIAPGYNYATLLKAYECSQQKGFFPFEHVRCLKQLNETSLPPKEAFYSSLNGDLLVSDSDYKLCQDAWDNLKVKTLRNYLIWYNNLDVAPFLEALEKLSAVYAERNVDAFKDGLSVSGLAYRDLFDSIDTYFFLPNNKNKDIYYAFKDNIVAGPSIVFCRYHESNKTKIRDRENGKFCRTVKGFDANALYLSCIMKDMPCQMFIRRRASNGFRPEYPQKYGRMAREWLSWIEKSIGRSLQRDIRGGEKRVGDRRIPVDGYDKETKTCYNFHGCFFHGHDPESCPLNANHQNPEISALLNTKRQHTQEVDDYILNSGYNLVIIKECEWHQIVHEKSEIRLHCDSQKTTMELRYKKRVLSEGTILDSVLNEHLFGVLEVDIEVPKELKQHFSELPPIFKNALVDFKDIGKHMQSFVIKNGLSTKPKRLLLASMYAKKIMLITPLLKWLLEHGVTVTKIYQVIEYHKESPFKTKGERISNIRREADVNPDKQVLADTEKAIGNSYYGKTATNKFRHRSVKFCSLTNASKLVNRGNFQHLEVVGEDAYEVSCLISRLRIDLPIQIAFFVYNYAKLRMLQFYYDFLDVYFDRSNFELCEMDTDSLYIAFAANELLDLVQPGKREDFVRHYGDWFPRPACDEHLSEWQNKYLSGAVWVIRECCSKYERKAKRTPGLFKLEWEGQGMICLSSKSYYAFGATKKYSCKGVQKQKNVIDKDTFLNVLETGETEYVKNKGFRMLGGKMNTYMQVKAGFTYNYWKRIVGEDGVTTKPLNI